MSFSDKFWKYINEGNLHIVLQIIGTDYVIRLIKDERNSVDLKQVYDSVDFVNFIMLPLLKLGKSHYQEVIQLSESELEDLNKNLSQFRPENRKFLSIISPYAIRAPNLTLVAPKCGTNYCIEIKPKEGFIASPFKKYSKCYYCLKQFLKLQNNLIKNISNFCPLDLFSGDKMRMKHALQKLIDNPQNNFKVFKDGCIIYNNESSRSDFELVVQKIGLFRNSINLLLDFIIEILLNNGKESNTVLEKSEGVAERLARKHCLEENQLLKHGLLYRIYCLQKLSEISNFDDSGDKSDDFGYVSSVIDEVRSRNLNLSTDDDKQLFLNETNPKYLALVSAVARDCSVMISFSLNYEEGYPTIEICDSKIPYKISVTDLEPKSAKTLAKRTKTERQLIDIYEKFLNDSAMQECHCKYFRARIQPHIETRAKQLEAWEQLIAEYMKSTKQSIIDIRESQNSPLFNNSSINRKLSQESLLIILEDMAKKGRAAPVDKSKNVWEMYWHSLDEWGNMIYSWASNNGLNNSVCTIFELREGDNTVDEEFHSLDMNILVKALKSLQAKGKCELIEFDDNQGVKFF